ATAIAAALQWHWGGCHRVQHPECRSRPLEALYPPWILAEPRAGPGCEPRGERQRPRGEVSGRVGPDRVDEDPAGERTQRDPEVEGHDHRRGVRGPESLVRKPKIERLCTGASDSVHMTAQL